ncbi:PQQ-binding-like beta-propeller repeat protein [Actinoplanes bogorensis]|uniref:PQQ-binding-like beta-propeller repeat protein n=1 Tax=Paractinoplanes bogorensis TaxID=1610840 RepID=A0ABS5YIW5_9ACTN|nr:PQQ-binding-like beta-propeller repeat protein [Actinoplanes bogorensis]MBU2663386.1 PQQ-binding-like beta-propeller repeat protein [Actinoplanes bogorensis]
MCFRKPMLLAALLSLLLVPGWDHAGYDAEDSYYNPAESQINASTINTLTQRWSVPLRSSSPSCSGPSAPLVADGAVIATDARGVASYQASSGRRSWTFDWDDVEDSTTPSMAVASGLLLLANGDCHSASDPNGRLVALDVATGRVRWRHDLDMPVDSFVVDRGVAVISGSSESDETATVAYRVADGRQMWRKVGYLSSSSASAGRLLLTKGTTTTAVTLPSGAVLWTKPRSMYAESATPTRFLTTDGAALSLIDAASGALLWTAPGQQSKLLATDGRRVYRAVGRKVSALDIRDGRVVWTRTLATPATQPVRAGGLVYVGGPILSAASGVVVSPGIARGAQVVTGGSIYLAEAGKLTAVAPRR